MLLLLALLLRLLLVKQYGGACSAAARVILSLGRREGFTILMPWATDLVKFCNLQLIFKLLIVKQEVSAGKLVMCRECLQHGLMSRMLHVASACHYRSHPLTQPFSCPAATAPERSLPLMPILHDSLQSEK